MSACILPGKESRSCCPSPGQMCVLLELSCQPAHRALLVLTPQPRSAAAALPEAATARFGDSRKSLGMKHCARSMAFRTWKILQVFYDLTGDLYYTKGPLSFISCIPVKAELQFWYSLVCFLLQLFLILQVNICSHGSRCQNHVNLTSSQ